MSDLMTVTSQFRPTVFRVDDPNAFFRIMPVGEFDRWGRAFYFTMDDFAGMVSIFDRRIPDFNVPVTLVHNDMAGKVGDVVQIEAREDGLYARVRWNADGLSLLSRGAFQYFSAEIECDVEWAGETLPIVLTGLSLVNQPYFGELTALFSGILSKNNGLEEQTTMTTAINEERFGAILTDSLRSIFGAGDKDLRSEFVALKEQNKELSDKLDEAMKLIEREREDRAREKALLEAQAARARYSAILGTADDNELVTKLADVEHFDAGLATSLAQEIKAIREQSKTDTLFSEIGTSVSGDDRSKFTARLDELVKGGTALADAVKEAAKTDFAGYRDWSKTKG